MTKTFKNGHDFERTFKIHVEVKIILLCTSTYLRKIIKHNAPFDLFETYGRNLYKFKFGKLVKFYFLAISNLYCIFIFQ